MQPTFSATEHIWCFVFEFLNLTICNIFIVYFFISMAVNRWDLPFIEKSNRLKNKYINRFILLKNFSTFEM
jgi:hypothetical protein